MDVWQAGRQLAYLLKQAKWPDLPTQAVLTDAFVSEDLEGNFLPLSFLLDGPTPSVPPFARVEHVSAGGSEESVGRISRAVFRVWVVAGGSGVAAGGSGIGGSPGVTTSATGYDSHGINQETGQNRDPVSGQGKSTGRSVDEVIGQLVAYFGGGILLTDSKHGVQGVFTTYGAKVPVDGVQIMARPVEIVLYNGSVQRVYHQPWLFAGTNAGGGVVNLTWTAPPARFDFVNYVVRRGTNPGDPAPSSPTLGQPVTVTGTTAQATGLVTGSTYNFSIFVGYGETPAAQLAATPDRYSNPVSTAVGT